MTNELKQMMADEIRACLDASPQCLVVGLRPMDSASDLDLRNTLRGQGASLRVIRNRTSRFALDEARGALGEYFVGQTALALIPGEEPDTVVIAKTLVEAQRRKKVEVRGGYIDGEVLDKAGVEMLAASPDKNTLRAMICGAINGAARGIAASLNAVGEGIARCVQSRIDKENDSQTEE